MHFSSFLVIIFTLETDSAAALYINIISLPDGYLFLLIMKIIFRIKKLFGDLIIGMVAVLAFGLRDLP